MNINLIEVSTELKKIDFNRKISWTSSNLSLIRCGLYLMAFDNNGGAHIKDKNVNKNTGAIGKIIVPENKISIKFGKFENGFISRMHGYFKDVHRPPEINIGIF